MNRNSSWLFLFGVQIIFITNVFAGKDYRFEFTDAEKALHRRYVKVKSSDVHGRGVFAKVDIPASTFIGVFKGQPVGLDGPYVLWIDQPNRKLLLIDTLPPFGFANHSENPNFYLRKSNSWFREAVTLRRIRAGEELTWYYAAVEGGRFTPYDPRREDLCALSLKALEATTIPRDRIQRLYR